jgi:predicted transcriptional regulator
VPADGLPELHDLEREVMEEVWDRGEAVVRTVLDALNGRSERQRAYTTVMTVLIRLHEKGLLKRRQAGRGHVYSPAVGRDEYADGRARDEVGALVDEYGELALVHFARHMQALDPKRRDQLRRLARRD